MNNNSQSSSTETNIKPDYTRHATLWESSNQNQHEYCRANNLSYGLFVAERSKLLTKQGKTRKQNLKGKFVQLSAQMKHDNHVDTAANLSGHIVLRLAKGSVIELPASLNAEQLTAVFKSIGNVL